MPTNEPPKGRRNVPLYVVLPPDERERVDQFARAIDRPLSWVVRDALRAYLDTVGRKAARMEAQLRPASIPAAAMGKTKQGKRGRPRKGDA